MSRSPSEAGKYSNRKFKTLERRVAKEFRDWTGVDFRRTPGSGGLNKATSYKVGEKEFTSDLMADRPLAYSIEIKSGVGFSLDAMLVNPDTCRFTKWWLQVCNDADSIDTNPLLWFKPQPNLDWIALDAAGVQCLNIPDSIPSITVRCYYGITEGIININNENIPVSIDLTNRNPIMFKWKHIRDNVNSEGLFNGLWRM